jgi:hypothetical protein
MRVEVLEDGVGLFKGHRRIINEWGFEDFVRCCLVVVWLVEVVLVAVLVVVWLVERW